VRSAPTLIVLVLASGCGIPRDPHGTLDRVRGGTLRAGVSVNEPWTRVESGRPAGVEVTLVREFADELDANVEWVVGSESELMAALERWELDVVVGGLGDDTPWRQRVGLTGAYLATDDPHGQKVRHVVAVPPGENGWLVRLERFLFAREDRARDLLRAEARR
jgi:ABC-type amino acid transport substrate-binding protein